MATDTESDDEETAPALGALIGALVTLALVVWIVLL
jgi:hypothetical protein